MREYYCYVLILLSAMLGNEAMRPLCVQEGAVIRISLITSAASPPQPETIF